MTPDADRHQRPLKVLLLLHELSLTGAPISAVNALEAIHDRVEVRILATDRGSLMERCEKLGPVTLVYPIVLNAHSLPARARRKFRKQLLGRELNAWKPDVIYANGLGSLHLLNEVPVPTDRPMLLHVHELDTVAYGTIERDGQPLADLHRAGRLIAVSEPVKRMLIEVYKIPEEKIACIPEPIPDAISERAADPSQRTGEVVVGGSGTLNERKGVLLWLLAAAEVIKRVGPGKVRFQWVGARYTFNDSMYAYMAKRLGIEDSVVFVPVTPDPAAFYRNFDMFAMTSWEDPCPLVVEEAMALGVPVVCFAGSGGPPYQVGDTGVVVPEFSPIAMADAIVELLSDTGRRRALGEAAKMRFHEQFKTSVVAPKILAELVSCARR